MADAKTITSPKKREYLRLWYLKNREKKLAQCKARYAKKRDHIRKQQREYAKKRSKQWYASLRPEAKALKVEKHRRWREANRNVVRAATRAWNAKNKDRRRANNRASARRRAGLPTPTRPCPSTCECCGGPPGKMVLHLDHCHQSGAFRGWLCSKCNVSIGMLGDTVDRLMLAVAYLKRSSAGNEPAPAIPRD